MTAKSDRDRETIDIYKNIKGHHCSNRGADDVCP
jgi:hypothetical protein